MLESPIQIALLFGAALIVFGPKKLPELGKALGQGIGNFKRSLHDAQEEVKNGIRTTEPPKSSPDDEDGAAVQTSSSNEPAGESPPKSS